MRERFELHVKIVERAERMGIGAGDRITKLLDISNADKQCNLRLDEFLNADDYEFAHDFIGIQAYIDRTTGKLTNCFWPRFSGA